MSACRSALQLEEVKWIPTEAVAVEVAVEAGTAIKAAGEASTTAEAGGRHGSTVEAAGGDATAIEPTTPDVTAARTKRPNPRARTWPTGLPKSRFTKRIRTTTVQKGNVEFPDVDACRNKAAGEQVEVNILSMLPNNFYTQLEAKIWSERKEALEKLEKMLNETPKIAPADYMNLLSALKDVILDDSNVVVVCIAIKCICGLAKRLKNKFQPYAVGTMRTILEKFKEKKANVVAALREATDHVYATTTLQQLQQEILNNMDSTYTSIKSETALFLARCFTKATPTTLNKKFLHVIIPALWKSLSDQDVIVRASAAQALGMAMKVIGEEGILSFFEDEVDDRKMGQIKDYFDSCVHLQEPIKNVEATKEPAALNHKLLDESPIEPEKKNSHKDDMCQPQPNEEWKTAASNSITGRARLKKRANILLHDDSGPTQGLETDDSEGWNDFPAHFKQNSDIQSEKLTEEAIGAGLLNKLLVLSLLKIIKESSSNKEITDLLVSSLFDSTSNMDNAGRENKVPRSNPARPKNEMEQQKQYVPELTLDGISRRTDTSNTVHREDPDVTQRLEICNENDRQEFSKNDRQDPDTADYKLSNGTPGPVLPIELTGLTSLESIKEPRPQKEIPKSYCDFFYCSKMEKQRPSKASKGRLANAKTVDLVDSESSTEANSMEKAETYGLGDSALAIEKEKHRPAVNNGFNENRQESNYVNSQPTEQVRQPSLFSFKGVEAFHKCRGSSTESLSALLVSTSKTSIKEVEPRVDVKPLITEKLKNELTYKDWHAKKEKSSKAPKGGLVHAKMKHVRKLADAEPSAEDDSMEQAGTNRLGDPAPAMKKEKDTPAVKNGFNQNNKQNTNYVKNQPTGQARQPSFFSFKGVGAFRVCRESSTESLSALLDSASKTSIKEVEPRVDIKPLITEQLKNELTYKDWHARLGAVFKLQEIISTNPKITGNLSDTPLLITRCVIDVNAEVAYATIVTVDNLFKAMGHEGRKHVKVFLPSLLRSIGHPKAWIRNAVHSCLNTIGQTFGEEEFFENKIIADALNSGSLHIRAEQWNWLKDKLPRVPTIPKDELYACLPVLFEDLTNRNDVIKAAAAGCVHGFMIHLGTWAMYTASEEFVEETNLDAVESILDEGRRKLPNITDATSKQRINSKIPVQKTSRVKSARRLPSMRFHTWEEPAVREVPSLPGSLASTTMERTHTSLSPSGPSPPPQRPWWRVNLPFINQIF